LPRYLPGLGSESLLIRSRLRDALWREISRELASETKRRTVKLHYELNRALAEEPFLNRAGSKKWWPDLPRVYLLCVDQCARAGHPWRPEEAVLSRQEGCAATAFNHNCL